MKKIFILLITSLLMSCGKDKGTPDRIFKIEITGSGYSYNISKKALGSPSYIVVTENPSQDANFTYEFIPLIGQSIRVSTSVPNATNLGLKVFYKGSQIYEMSCSGACTLTKDFDITN